MGSGGMGSGMGRSGTIIKRKSIQNTVIISPTLKLYSQDVWKTYLLIDAKKLNYTRYPYEMYALDKDTLRNS
ncbi:hypothetical protein STEG23_012554 [Scotinomys teguina]